MKFQVRNSSMAERLVLSFGGSFILLSCASGLLLFFMMSHQLSVARGLILHDRLAAISTLLKSPAHGLEELKSRIEKEWPLRTEESVFVQVIDADGKPVSATPVISPGAFEMLEKIGRPPGYGSSEQVVVDDQGKRYLVRTETLQNSLGLNGPINVRLAVANQQGDEFLSLLRKVLVGVFIFNVLLSLFVGWQIVRRQLARLEKISRQVSQIDTANLKERIDIEGLPRELATLAITFNRTFDRLFDSFERLTRFSSDIAHELRTPAANITASIEVALSRPRSAADYCDFLESNLEECARITRITDSLLFLARAENLAGPLLRENVSLSSEIEGMIEFYEPLASEKEIEISWKPANTGVFEIMADKTLLQRILSNLLSNAIRFTGQGGRIRVVAHTDQPDLVCFAVSDTGPGIPAEHLPRIFDRFYRVDPSRNLHSGGAGLGLAIAKSIAEIHGGTISVQSEPGKGTTFTVCLPIRAV